jgi:hypothetical protein
LDDLPNSQCYRDNLPHTAAASSGAPPSPYLHDPLEGVEISGSPGSRTFSLTEGSLVPEGDPNSAEMEAEAINLRARRLEDKIARP